jgi:3-methyladenine DNA glycosylase AlkD
MGEGIQKLRNSKTTEPKFTSNQFIDKLTALPKNNVANNSKYFKDQIRTNIILGIRMSSVFGLAKQFTELPIAEIQKLLKSAYYEARMGAISIMDFQARNKKTPTDHRRRLYELYLHNHKTINNWDLVDRGAPSIVGGYLYDKERTALYKLARSKKIWERRTAIVSTYFFIKQNDIEDTFKIAEILLFDEQDLINKAVGSWIREAGKRDKEMLLNFLNKYADKMPRVTLRYAIEKLDDKQKKKYMNTAKQINC